MANFIGTNIPLSTLDALKAEDPGKFDRIKAHLASAIKNNDSRDVNEAIFSIAFFSKQKPGSEEYGIGPGNANVSKVHTSEWRANPGVVDDYAPWSVDHINSSNAVHKLHSGIPSGVYMFEPGDVITYDDKKGVGVNGTIIDSWGQRGHTEQGGKWGLDNPHVGKKAAAPTNPEFVGGADNTDLKSIWPDIDWDTQGDTDLEQYDYWPTQGVSAGTELGQYGPTVTKGLFGFSDKDPADLAKPAFNYLNAYGIGSNLAYKPWHSAAWRGAETAEEKADKTTPRTYYGGIPGGTKTRDQLYHYGGSQTSVVRNADGTPKLDKDGNVIRETLLQPMQVPGGWKTATLPEGSQSVYPIARTPLFPSGAISPKGAVAPYVKPATTTKTKTKTKNGTTGTTAGAGKILANYMGRAGAFGGTSTGGKNLMFQVTGEPTKRDIGGGKTSWGDMALDLFQGGRKFKTTAYRAMTGKDWTDADNQWILRRTGEMREGADVQLPNIKFASWAGGTPTVGSYGRTPTLDFLGTPQNQMVEDPTSGERTKVAYTLPTSYGKSYSTGGSETLAPYISGTTSTQPWAQLAGMKSAGFPTDYGGKWVLPGIYGHEVEQGDIRTPTTNLLGYGLPRFLTDAMIENAQGGEIDWGTPSSDYLIDDYTGVQ